jgi:predicted nucleotidyltransferase
MPLSAPNFAEVLALFQSAGVRFILIGGGAGIAHGLARFTQDIDVVYARDDDNLQRIVEALAPHRPYPRGAPPGLPFLWDAKTLKAGLNFTLSTGLGFIDLLGEVTGGGGYEELLQHTIVSDAYGVPVRLVTLERLIQLKHAAGRPKDFEVLAELQALLEERNRKSKASTSD